MTDTFLLIFAALIVGASKGGLASAAAIAVPMLALFMNPVKAAATLLPVYIVTDWIGVWLYRRDFSARNIWILTPSILFGVAIATVITPYTPEPALLIFTGLIGVWYCGRAWLGRASTEKTEARVAPGIFWGTLTGIASFITHSGAPPSQAYLLPQKLGKLEFAGTIAISFAVGNLVKLPAYYAIGQLDGLNWGLIAGLALAGIIGTIGGRALTKVLPEHTYVRMIQVMLLILSVILLARGGAQIIA
ncbi:sulfite exporter TauE/SafE family protein [Pseudooceanicola sp. CBS1P-1]|uniref:Probable membrane transporter protein n=1 Tax=Pseudooceanicola albus TaxID=2692189 RepID=A0A6L7G7F2_9RHOB|nr:MULTISPECIES: sulfite exporter TauE/SafE family protein [Pseudooceanicola]MBT9386841.1 sulfite exporter TauE/SafE family protein [Pseudooceanicola endophyticus]MXN19336.1 TSUP family transporter [Pseudooceanicola albus]